MRDEALDRTEVAGRLSRVEKRNLVSSFFITLLIGIAYGEMVTPVRESVRAEGITPASMLLLGVFFLTSMRFFVGNQLHLLSDNLVELPGLVWLYDLMAIIAQSVLLIFLGGVSSVSATRNLEIGFIELLAMLCLVDIAWIASQATLGRILPKWRREFVPWGWAILNGFLVVGLALIDSYFSDPYSDAGLWALFLLNAIAFVVDVILFDYYDAL